METDISPIFGNNNPPEPNKVDIGAIVPDRPIPDSSSPLHNIIEPPHPEQLEPEYSQQQFYPQQPTFMYPPPPPPSPQQQQKWDPFSSVGATAWVVMALAFIIGFIVGKLR